MIKYEDFNEFYSNLDIDEQEIFGKWNEIKNKNKKANIISVVIVCIVDLLILLFAGQITIFTIVPMLMIDSFIFVFFSLTIPHGKYRDFNDEYKDTLMDKMLGNFIEELDYVPKKSLSSSIYDEAHYNTDYDIYHAEDYIQGKIDGQNVVMADLLVQREEKVKNSDGKEEKKIVTLFSGLFSKIELNKSINTQLKIFRDYGMSIKTKDKLEMDSREFEKKFNVYTDNKIIGMQLLTSDIQENILDLFNRYGIDFYIYINNNNLYILFNTNNMFEIFSNKKNPKEKLEEYFEVMKFIHKMVEQMTKTIKETQV